MTSLCAGGHSPHPDGPIVALSFPVPDLKTEHLGRRLEFKNACAFCAHPCRWPRKRQPKKINSAVGVEDGSAQLSFTLWPGNGFMVTLARVSPCHDAHTIQATLDMCV